MTSPKKNRVGMKMERSMPLEFYQLISLCPRWRRFPTFRMKGMPFSVYTIKSSRNTDRKDDEYFRKYLTGDPALISQMVYATPAGIPTGVMSAPTLSSTSIIVSCTTLTSSRRFCTYFFPRPYCKAPAHRSLTGMILRAILVVDHGT